MVVFHPDLVMLGDTLRALRRAVDEARAAGAIGGATLTVVDNGTPDEAALDRVVRESTAGATALDVCTRRGHGNVGYGRGHNLALADAAADYHLILNPDVIMAPDALGEAIRFLEQNPDAVLVAPEVTDGQGTRQYLCRRYPSVLVLLLRGFAPEFLRRRFRRRLDAYEMRDVILDAVVKGVPLASGCFMFARLDRLRAVGGFSPRYFLYFEDHDLSLALAKHGTIAYVPDVRIIHHGGGAARKGLRHILLYVRSALAFFRTHGWKWV